MGFVHTVKGSPEVLGAMKEKVERQGGEFEGDACEGCFRVQGFEGKYSTDGSSLTLEITKKPVFVPDSMIKAWLDSNFS